MKCSKCGKELTKNDEFCNACGNKVSNKSKRNILFISLIVVMCLGMGVALFFILDLNKSFTDTQKEVFIKDFADPVSFNPELNESDIKIKPDCNDSRTANIELLGSVKKGDTIILVLKNNNKDMINTTFYVNFYNGATRIGSNIDSAQMVKPGAKFIIELSTKYDENYEDIDITASTRKSNSYYIDIPIDESKLSIKEEERSITTTFKNEYNKTATFYGAAIFYKDGKITYADDTIDSNVKTGETVELTIYTKIAEFEYDNYEFVVHSAYSEADSY